MYDRFLIKLTEHYKSNTINNIHAAVSMTLSYAIECDLLASNPAKKPKTAQRLQDITDDIEEKYLSRAEVEQLIKIAKKYFYFQNFALLRLLIYSGLRIGEALALEIPRIDFKYSMIKIRQTISTSVSKNVKDFQLQTPKTTASIRDVELDAETMEILRRQILEQKKKKLKAGSKWYNEHEFLFTSERYPMFYTTFKHKFNRLLKIVNLNKPITIHSLRHTHASLLAECGATLEQIQQRLGHSNDDITKRVYLHVTKDSKMSMIENFAAFMSNN